MFDDFLVRATVGGIGVALAAGPLGCFVVWRRMAYFGDATAHASILGVALALALSLPVFLGALTVALIMALTVSSLRGRGLATDTLLGVLAHASLAIGLVAVSFLENVRLDLMAFLFGDILAVGMNDLAIIWIGAVAILGLLASRWTRLLMSTLNADLAHASGIDPKLEQTIMTVALAIVVAVAIKVVGVLLIAALLIIPAATARPLSRSPEHMAVLAAGFGVASVLIGLQFSLISDAPAGPAIVCAAAALFVFVGISAQILWGNTRS